MSSDGRVRVVVRSRRVPVDVVEFHQSLYSPSGIPMGIRTHRQVLYAYVLGEDHQRTIEEAAKLARSLCLGLEVIDSGKNGFFRRLLLSLGRSGANTPSIVVSPPPTSMTSDSSRVLGER